MEQRHLGTGKTGANGGEYVVFGFFGDAPNIQTQHTFDRHAVLRVAAVDRRYGRRGAPHRFGWDRVVFEQSADALSQRHDRIRAIPRARAMRGIARLP